MKKSKKTQTEVITTVLLILISIAAVIIISTFVMNTVKNNLKNTDCFQTTGQIWINMIDDATYFDTSESNLSVSIARGVKEFNLSAINLVYGNSYSSQLLKLVGGSQNENISYYALDGTWHTENLKLPKEGESTAYKIQLPAGSSVTKISISAILTSGSACDLADEKTIKSFD
jgi:ABC-type lipoprotein release transport system permease subunit